MNTKLISALLIILFAYSITSCKKRDIKPPVNTPADTAEIDTTPRLTLSKAELKDKIKGGWAGQTIGVTFGGPTEFKYLGKIITAPIAWMPQSLKNTMNGWPDLYDDIYMDITFVDVLENTGLDAPVDAFANAFAHAEYNLWHANQAARNNILNNIKAPASGHWLNNPHADDIDYQIEADYSGLMHPGMPNSASALNDKVGHIMNYGDGWYGGVYVGALYSLAFTSKDVDYVVKEALKTIPPQSQFYQCINDVINWHRQFPADWKLTWAEVQKKWANESGCPDGVLHAFDIDAKINAAYIVIGLLYGEGDYTQTIDIATRCGQDSDCNPSSAAGVLGTMIGYSKIPDYWKAGLADIEDINFKYTSMSLNRVYDVSYRHALQTISINGGIVSDTAVTIKLQAPAQVKFEQSFENMYPVKKVWINPRPNPDEIKFEFEGTGFSLRGGPSKKIPGSPDYTYILDFYIDDVKTETIKMPTNYRTRRLDICWKYGLPAGKHKVKIVVINPHPDYKLDAWEYKVLNTRL